MNDVQLARMKKGLGVFSRTSLIGLPFDHPKTAKSFDTQQEAEQFQQNLGPSGEGSVIVNDSATGKPTVHYGSSYQEAALSADSQANADDAMAFNSEVATANLELAQSQIAIAEKQQAMSEEQYNYWKTTFKPLEKDVAESARVGIDPAQAAARAGSDVTASFAKSKEQAARDATRVGIDASSGRYQQQQDSLAIAQAAAEAGARTQARNVTTDTNYQKMLNAVSIGRGLPTTSASMSANAANTYGAAAGTQRGAADTYQQGINTSIAVNNQGIQSAQYQQGLNAQATANKNAATASAIGGVAQLGTTAGTLYALA